MFGPPGHLYVYRSYGLHWCANVVCGGRRRGSGGAGAGPRAAEGAGGDVRGRAGIRRDVDLCSGPGKLTQALGLSGVHNGVDLTDPAGVHVGDDGSSPRRSRRVAAGSASRRRSTPRGAGSCQVAPTCPGAGHRAGILPAASGRPEVGAVTSGARGPASSAARCRRPAARALRRPRRGPAAGGARSTPPVRRSTGPTPDPPLARRPSRRLAAPALPGTSPARRSWSMPAAGGSPCSGTASWAAGSTGRPRGRRGQPDPHRVARGDGGDRRRGLRAAVPAIDLDVHRVEPPGEAPHLHLDVRYLRPPRPRLASTATTSRRRWPGSIRPTSRPTAPTKACAASRCRPRPGGRAARCRASRLSPTRQELRSGYPRCPAVRPPGAGRRWGPLSPRDRLRRRPASRTTPCG